MKNLIFLIFALTIFNGYSQVLNDSCSVAEAFILPSSGTYCFNGTTAGATSDGVVLLSCDGGIAGNEVWYTFVATNENISITVTPTGGSPIQNTSLTYSVFPCGFGISSGCNTATGTNAVNVSGGVSAGDQVWFSIESLNNMDGGFEVCVESTPAATTPGNTCAQATVICDKSTIDIVDLAPYNASGIQPSCFGANVQKDVWIQFTVGTTGTLEFTGTPVDVGNEYDWALYDITNGCPGTEVSCDYYTNVFDDCDFFGMSAAETQTGNNGLVQDVQPPITVIAGHTYALMVDNYSGENSGFSLEWGGTFQMGSTASFDVTPEVSCGAPLTVDFTNNSIGAVSYSWNFGDGTGSTLENPGSHTYTSEGQKLVSLLITGADGCTNIATKIVNITQAPIITINPIDPSICVGESLDIVATAVVGTPYVDRQFTQNVGTTIPTNNAAGLTNSQSTSGMQNTTIQTGMIQSICFTINHSGHADIGNANANAVQITVNGNTYNYTPLPLPNVAGIATYCFPQSVLNAIEANGGLSNTTWTIKVADTKGGNIINPDKTGSLVSWDIVLRDVNFIASTTWSPTTNMTNSSTLTPTVTPNVTTTYYLSAIDAFGCEKIDSITIIVDNEGPIMACPGDLTASCDISEQPAYTDFEAFMAAGGTASDLFELDTLSFTLLSEVSDNNSCPETVTRVYQIADTCGNVSTCIQDIVVNDIIAPTGTAPADVTVECIADIPAADVAAITDEADNCTASPLVTHIGDVDNGATCPKVITRTYQIEDDCGNTTDLVQTITINDITAPTGTAPADVTVECIADVPAADVAVITDEADNCTASPIVTHIGDVDNGATCPKVITRTYQIEDDCGNTTDLVQTITINDITAPTGTAPADVTVECIADVPAADIAAITDEADNCTANPIVTHIGDVDNGATCPKVITRTYQIEDDCGNTTDLVQTITINDITAPTGTAPADVTVECIADVPAADIAAITDEADNCTANPTVTHIGDVDNGATCPKVITRTYQIEDDCGNTTDLVQTITINDITAPTGTAPADVTVECIADVPAADVAAITDEADNCTANPTVTHIGDVDNGATCPKVITRTYQIEDDCGNTTDLVQTITINDITAPTGTAPADVTVECIADVPAADVAVITDEADNCTASPLVTHIGDVDNGATCPKVITRTYQIEDDCGNTTDLVQTITINDITAPTGTAPADVTVECIADVPVADVAAITDEADNCTASPTVTHVSDVSDGNACNGEIITRTYEIEDDCGNSIQVTQLITIDAVTPTFTLSSTDPTICGGTDGTITISGLDPATDYEFSFNGQASTTITTDGSGEYVITGLPAGSYTNFNVADANCLACSTTNTTTINLVEPGSPAIDAGADQQVCEGTDVTLTATNPDGATISWNNGVNDGVPFTPTAGTVSYTVTADLAGCVSTDVVIVTVTPVPSIDPIADIEECVEATLPNITGTNLTANVSFYDGANGSGNQYSDGDIISTIGVTTFYVYDETGTTPNCFDETSFTVTINENPIASILPDPAMVCEGGVLNVDGNPSGGSGNFTTHAWSNAGSTSLSSTTTQVSDFSNATAGTYDLTYTVTDNNGCVGSDDITVTVNPAPVITLSGQDLSVCNGTDGIITVNGTGTGVVTWSGASSGTSGTVALPFDITNLEAGSYDVVFTSDFGCVSSTVSTSLNNPGAPIIDPITDTISCNVSYTLNLANVTGTDLTANIGFYSATGGNAADQIPDGTVFSAPTNTIVYVYDANGACVSEVPFNIVVNGNPTASISPDPAEVCAGLVLNLDGSPVGGSGNYTSHVWSGTGVTSLSATNSQLVDFTSLTAGTYDLTYTVTDDAGCIGSDDITVTVNANPTASISPNPVELCAGELILLDGNPSGGSTTYSTHGWTGAGAGSLSSTSTQLANFTNSTAGTYDLTYTVTDNNGCIGSDDITVTVNEVPVITLAPQDPTVCNGSDGQITVNGTATGVVSWSGASSGTSATVTLPFIISGLASGSYDVTFTSDAGCTSAQVSTVLNNPGAPVLDPIANYTSCAIDYQLLVASITGTGLTGNQAFYSAPGGNAANLIPDGTVLSAPTNMTVYAYDENGTCSSEISFTVEINENPTATIAPNPAEVCAGLDLVVNSNPSGGSGNYSTHSWTGSGASSLNSTLTQDVVFNNVAAGVYNLTYTVTDDNGCIGSDNSVITVNANPTANITPDPAEVCAGVDLALDGNPANGNAVYTAHAWTGAGSSSLNTTNSATPLFNNSAAGNYGLTYTVTDENGCVGTDNITVVVNPIPTITLTPQNPSACGGSDGQIEVSGVGTGVVSWTGAANGTSAVVTLPFIISNLSPGSYDVIFTSTAGCVSQIKSTNIVNPGAPVITPLNDYTSCNINYTVQDPLTSITGSNLTGNQAYYSAPGGLTANIVTPGTVITSAMSPYVLYAFDVDGLCSTEESFVVTVHPEPGSTATNNGPVCDGNPIVLNETSGNAVSWSWSSNGSAVISNVNSQSPTVTNGSTNEVFTVTIADANGCESTAQTTITINPLPNVNAGPDVSLCEGESVTLNGQGALIYSWNNGVSNGASFTPATTQVYTVVGTDANGCQNSDNVTVTVNEIPVILFDASPTNGCAPLLVNFTNNSTGNSSECIWDLGDGTVLNNCSNFSHTYTNGGDFTVTLTSTTAEGCSSSLSLQDYIHVENPPIASFIPSTTVLSETEPEVFLNNTSQGAVSYEWNFGDGTVETSVNPSHEYYTEEPGGYVITLIAYSEMGCTDTAEVFLRVKEELIYYVPNSFTPDGDQFNQTFQPVFTSGFDIYNFNMLIFNRWGEIVFETNDASIGWDGTHTGSIAPDGVYTWKIVVKTSENDERKEFVGHVNLIR